MPIALLLAMQASGMIVDFMGTRNQARLSNMGADLEQEEIQSNIEQTRLETEDASLQGLKQLRQNLGTQAAVLAARGTASGAGSAVLFGNESVGNFNADERTRRMNLLAKEKSLQAGSTIARLNAQGENTKLWSSFASRSINRFPSSLEGWKSGVSEIKKSFGLTQGA